MEEKIKKPATKLRDFTEWNETINAMSSISSPYAFDYVYYLHMLAQCKTYLSDKIPTAGVCFRHDHFELLINEEFFRSLPIQERIGLLKHEMLHILNGHLTFRENNFDDQKLANVAMDCAINQSIQPEHLPQGGITPANFPSKVKCPSDLTSEQYYELLDKNKDEGKLSEMADSNGNSMDSHDTWQESEGNEQVSKDIAKRMAEKAAKSTQNNSSPGRLPSEYSKWIELLSKEREVNWKKVLKRIVGNKKANKRKTLMKKDRRLPNMAHVKGKTKDRTFDLLVVSDVSGSVSDLQLIEVWNEIAAIAKVTNTPTTLIQIDTEPYEPQQLRSNITKMERKASGGTYLSPALEKAKERGITFDCIVVTTDNYLLDGDRQPFYDTGKKVIWLIDSDGGEPTPDQNSGKSIAIKLGKKSK